MTQAPLSVEHPSRARPAGALRIGIIGCGERGIALCAQVGKTANARLAMAVDANAALAQDVAHRFGVPWTTSLDEMLSSDGVDAVIISTPHHLHAPQAVQAAAAGKHLMVEKPLATSLADAIAVVRAAHRAGVQLSTILPYRYQPRVERAKQLIRAGALGDLFGVSLIFHDDKFADYWRGGHTGRATSDWRQRWETSGGGVLITSVIHHIDWLRYLPGLEIVEVSAMHTTLDSPGEVEDTITMWVRYENGALGTVNASSCVRGTDLVEFRFWGREGHLSLTPPYEFYSLRTIDGKRPGQWHGFSDAKGLRPRDIEYLQRFAERVLRGEPPEITGEDGLAAQAIVEAAYESARTGRAVQVTRRPWALDGS